MIHTETFVDKLIESGYTHLCVVPCSFVKSLINEAINNKNIEYLPAASEAVAVSIAAGLKMSGKNPIVIVQSSGLTNMGSSITSLLKPYGITFPILTSWRTYSDGDSEIQHQHLATELPVLINAYGYDSIILDKTNVDNLMQQINILDTTTSIGIIEKSMFSDVTLKNPVQNTYTKRSDFLKELNLMYKNSNVLFVGTTGNTAREMYTYMPDTNNFYQAGNMGGALSVGAGSALAGRKVIVLGGDAEFVMHMGGLTTAARYDLDLTYVVFDNAQNKSTGGQPTMQKHVDYSGIAKASGWNTKNVIFDTQQLRKELSTNKNMTFLEVLCGLDNEVPRPPLNVVKINKMPNTTKEHSE